MSHLRPVLLIVALVVAWVPSRAEEDAELARYDEKTLKDAHVGVDGPALLAFFRQRTLTDADLRNVAQWLVDLGDNDFEVREAASRKILRHGPAVLTSLDRALTDSDPEIRRRAREAIDAIDKSSSLPTAAARQLVRTKPAGAARALLNYLAFTNDAIVIDEVMDAILALAGKTAPTDPALRIALKDAHPQKRAAAGYVLGRATDNNIRGEVRLLLDDKDPMVRFRTAQGLLSGRDKTAVPTLIELATQPAGELTWQAEEALLRLSGTLPPGMKFGETEADRKARHEAWASWWKANEATVDMARYDDRPRFLNYTLVPEMHANKVWELSADRETKLWEVAVPNCPIDAQALPGGRFLVAELNGRQVTERDLTGKVLWTHKVDAPIACARLTNGNTFIGTNHSLHVVTREGKEVMSYKAEPSFFIHSVQRQANGNTICVSMEGTVREIDPAGKVIRDVKLPTRGSWSGVEGAPGGHYLAATFSAGKVVEVDHAGKVVWEYSTPGACYASRLPNGNTLVVSNNTGLLEVDRDGKVVWERKVGTSLWRAHRR